MGMPGESGDCGCEIVCICVCVCVGVQGGCGGSPECVGA